GDFAQTPTGSFTTEVADPDDGGQGQLVATGSISLDGALNVLLKDGFVPTDGQAFRIISGASRTSSFASTDGLEQDSGVVFDLTYNPADATLVTHSFPDNHPPVAVDDNAITSAVTPVTVAVLANDSDPDGDSLSIRSFTQASHGTVTKNLDNTLTYS